MNLPKWIEDSIPEVRKPRVISYRNKIYVLTFPNGEEKIFSTLEEAYDDHSGDDECTKIDSSVPEHGPAIGLITVPGKMGHRILFSSTDQEKLENLERTLELFKDTAAAYRDDPKNFMKSYEYISCHPAFWTKMSREKSFYWDTNSYGVKLWMAPHVNGFQEHYWMMEAGQHVGPEHQYHYHDLRLDVYAASVEGCYIELAEKVNKFFHDDGSERENVEYEKSEIELILDERIAEVEKNFGPIDSK